MIDQGITFQVVGLFCPSLLLPGPSRHCLLAPPLLSTEEGGEKLQIVYENLTLKHCLFLKTLSKFKFLNNIFERKETLLK